jgi:hypothetical protein
VSPGRETRSLLLKVGLVAVALVMLSRWAGSPGDARRGAAPDQPAGDDRGGTPSGAGGPLEASAMDLSFYSSLDTAPGRGGPPSLAGKMAREADAAMGEPGAGAGGVWVVQALATRDGARARRTRDRLAGAGLPAVLIEARAAGQPVYRVRVGRYADRPVAENLARRLKKEYGLEPWVLKEGE